MTAMLVFVLACGAPSSNNADPASTAENGSADATEVAQVNESVPPTDLPSNNPSVQHAEIPVGLPEKQSGQAGDFDSSNILNSGTLIGGDRFTYGRLERPFNANTMDVYFPEIDIVDTEVFQDDLWIYGRISIKDLAAGSSTSKYAVELDTDLNGKAEWLVVAEKPASSDWTVNGVRVYQDANKNVGGEFPMLTDSTSSISDGFETVFFDQGTGANPDTAWVRISPANPNIVEFAINRAALSNPATYLINYWAGHDIDPTKFDLNDSYTHEQAGAADKGLTLYYPIKAIAEIDNSCRMAVGFQPTGQEPGLCDNLKPAKVNNDSNQTSCTAPQSEVDACINDPSYAWNPGTCTCNYVGPK